MKSFAGRKLEAGKLLLLAVAAAFVLETTLQPWRAEAQEAKQAAPFPGLSRQPSAAAAQRCSTRTTPSSFCSTTRPACSRPSRTFPSADLRANTVALAKIAELAKMPIIYTASEPGGPNGPIMEELAAAAPSAKYVARKGEVSAWDNADFVKAVEATGRKTLVMAGVWTSVCVAFPALQAKADGYKVYCGDGRLGRREPDGVRRHARPDDAGRHHPRDHEHHPERVPPHLEPCRTPRSGARSTPSSCRTTAPSPRATGRPRTSPRSRRSSGRDATGAVPQRSIRRLAIVAFSRPCAMRGLGQRRSRQQSPPTSSSTTRRSPR